jgi:hypothetical protein
MSEAQVSTTIADVVTPQAARYLVQLCKHFQHKLPVTYDEQSGQISFSIGECRLRAEDGLLKIVAETADPAQMAPLQDVIARHLVRFAFREELQISWRAS